MAFWIFKRKCTDLSVKHPMPTIGDLRRARAEFKRIEPRDFFYWSVTKLVNSVFETQVNVSELVCALMMLLTTWNKNYYRFFKSRNAGATLEAHFVDLEKVIYKHLEQLVVLRTRSLPEVDNSERLVPVIFQDFTKVLGRVGAAKCLHLLAPRFFPLWDAAILKGYGMEKTPFRNSTEAERYVAFMGIVKVQLAKLGDISSFTGNTLKSLDEYNYCRFTKKVRFA